MATAVIMPKQGQSVETCIITKWFMSKGEAISVGDILFSYETDKASFDLEAPADGILLDIYFGEGDEVPVLDNVAVIGEKGEDTDSFHPGKSDSPVEEAVSDPETEVKEAESLKLVCSLIGIAVPDVFVRSPVTVSDSELKPSAESFSSKTTIA